jgi:beta-lactam-binding protein with PASTA domain
MRFRHFPRWLAEPQRMSPGPPPTAAKTREKQALRRAPRPATMPSVYDDSEDQFFQGGYPSQTRGSRPILAAVIASAITTIVVFFVLRELESVGFISTPRGRAPSGAIAGASSGGTAGAVQVPTLLGMRLEQARELLKGRGLLISIAEERDDPSHPSGAVLSQNPLGGSEAQPGTTVQLVIARAVANVIVPPVAGQKVEDAIAFLAAQGFKLGPQKTTASNTVAAGLVAGSDPAAGSSVSPGATLALLVAGPIGKPVPNVVGSRLNRGKKLLEDAGFKVGRTRYKYDPCCGEYIILEQAPAADQPATAGAAVDLIVNEPG